MHGVKRDRSQLTAELKAQRKEREAKKLHLYLDIEARFFAKRDADDLSTEALESTSLVLNINPELYSAWNFRRRILLHLFEHGEGAPPQTDLFASLRDDAGEEAGQASSSKEGGAIDSGSHDERHTDRRARKKQLLQEDLELTMQALQMHPKVYWIWNHRKWCLQCLPSDDVDGLAKWKMEIGMANKMLDYDPRNFHGWDYRRYILSQLALPLSLGPWSGPSFPQSLASIHLPDELKAHQLKLATDELGYTLSKIETNFSNFSAWHQRSLLLPAIWTAQQLGSAQALKRRDEEFELLRQAMFVDPEDQSVWTYHDWLVSLDPSPDVLDREIASIRELLDLEPDSRWCMQSLAHYLQLCGAAGSKTEAKRLLERLASVDPDRRQRYADTIAAV